MKKLFTPLLFCVVTAIFSGCGNSEKNANKNPADSISFSKSDISEKRWCFSSYVLYLKADQTCNVTRIEDDSNWAPATQWSLAHDTLLVIQKDEKLSLDTAFYKIIFSENKLTIKLVKELKEHYHKNYVVPYNDKDFNNNPVGDETIFWLDEENHSIEEKNITGSWHGDGRLNAFTLDAGGTCSASGEASQSIAAKVWKGKWKLQNDRILIEWHSLYQPTIEEDENGEKYSRDGKYDSLKISEYDTLHIIKSSSFRLVTKEYGQYLGGTNKDFLKSMGY